MPTEQIVPPKTLQELFDRTCEVLADRGWTQAGVMSETQVYDEEGELGLHMINDFKCKYRSPVGPCAVGIWIPDTEYQLTWDGQFGAPMDEVVSNCPSLAQWLSSIPHGHSLLSSMQTAHDGGSTPERMYEKFRKLTVETDWELTWKEWPHGKE